MNHHDLIINLSTVISIYSQKLYIYESPQHPSKFFIISIPSKRLILPKRISSFT